MVILNSTRVNHIDDSVRSITATTTTTTTAAARTVQESCLVKTALEDKQKQAPTTRSRRVQFSTTPLVVDSSSSSSLDNTQEQEQEEQEDLWYSEHDCETFARETLDQAKALLQKHKDNNNNNNNNDAGADGWAKSWLVVYFLLCQTSVKNPSSLIKVQAAVNAMHLSLTAETVGLQGHYLVLIGADYVVRQRQLQERIQTIQRRRRRRYCCSRANHTTHHAEPLSSQQEQERTSLLLCEASQRYSHVPRLYATLAAHVAANSD